MIDNNKMSRTYLEIKVLEWAEDKDLIFPENAIKQILKTMSELGELADAILQNDQNEILDGIGDMEVCLTLLKAQLGYEQDVPLALAYNEIKDRTGSTVNGTFIKDS